MKKKYPHTQDIKSVLKDKADFVQKDGLNRLIPNWQRFADEYADSESSIFEWLNDLDTRNIIDDILITLSHEERIIVENDLKAIDEKVREKTFEIKECVWGEKAEKEYKYDRPQNWYYYRMNQLVFDSEREFEKFTRLDSSPTEI